MKIIAIVQARMGSSRLPGKVMSMINEVPIIEILIKRLQLSKKITDIVVATSIDNNNDSLEDFIKKIGFPCERGSEDNVLERYYKCASKYNADVIVRITGDCPFVDPVLVDEVIENYVNEKVDYCSNTLDPTYPDGLDIEVFSYGALKEAYKNATTNYDKEHVTPYIRSGDQFSRKSISLDYDLSDIRLTLDEKEDLQLIENIFDNFKPNIYFSWLDIIDYKNKKPDVFLLNTHIKRNEGSTMGKGQKLYKRAKKVIPGGNMLLSKRPEMFLPEKWPSYFSKAKECFVWDLDGNKYIDMSIMGIGTNTLGYGDPRVDEAVRKNLHNGNMSTLNCPEEVYLAEKLIEMHPWADMAKFARSGGEANAIAIRIARAASGKDNVAICGYHGWHDWYLSANIGNDGLSDHLLPGLSPAGVPKNLKDSVFPFNYNDFDTLKKIVNENNIGVIKMEVFRNIEPVDNFLDKVRNLANSKNIVLIFDECTSGFRETFGGLHKKYNVEPDMAMFGKALGNGHAITSVIGKRSIMDAAQSTFISSTFWTERVGPTAALKTLEVMQEVSSWEQITNTGKIIRKGLKELASIHNISITSWGLDALTGYTFNSKNANLYKTFVTQEMLKKGFLASNSVYVCTKHNNEIVNCFLDALDPIFKIIKECEDGKDINEFLESPECHSGFARLN